MRATNLMIERPARAFGIFDAPPALKPETPSPSVARLIDIERTIWDPAYRRWAIDQLSKEDQA